MKTSYTSTNHRFYIPAQNISTRCTQWISGPHQGDHAHYKATGHNHLFLSSFFIGMVGQERPAEGHRLQVGRKVLEKQEWYVWDVGSVIYIHSAGTFSSCHSWQLEDVTPQGTIHQNPHRFTPELLQFPTMGMQKIKYLADKPTEIGAIPKHGVHWWNGGSWNLGFLGDKKWDSYGCWGESYLGEALAGSSQTDQIVEYNLDPSGLLLATHPRCQHKV